jgi:amino acid transporter
MEASQIYVLISIIVLLIIAVLLLFVNKGKKKKKERLTPLAVSAFAFVIAGICFGENKLISYSLMGVGVLIALIDMFKKLKNNR